MFTWSRLFWRWNMYRYQIDSLQFCWPDGNFPLVQDEFMSAYEEGDDVWEPEGETITYESSFLDLDRYRSARLLLKNETYELYDTDHGRLMIYHWARCRFGFGYWLDDLVRGNRIPCYFHRDMRNQTPPLTAVRFFSCAGMHSKLLQHGDMILHASYIAWKGQAILFAGPSGTGKSTQADLWRRYVGAELINGDRALIGRKNGVWYSYGYPCCGSSAVCINRTLPLSMIVILEQGEQNRIVSLSDSEKIRAIVSGTEMFPWGSTEISRAIDLAEILVASVPVIKLICRPDEEAVDLLRNKWKEIIYGKGV